MADDPDRDMFPTKETKSYTSALEINVSDKHVSPEKRFVHHISQSDLEDQFYKFKEENIQLKKSAKKQEEELKRLATKMTRLLREKKSIELSSSPAHKRDLELEEMVEDLQDKVRQLEKSNTHLREKVLVAKHQVILQSRRPNPYSHIPPKVNSGNFRQGNSPYLSSINLREKNLQNATRMAANASISPYAINLLEEARNELSNLKMLVSNQRNEIDMYQQENEMLKQKLRMKEIEFEDDLNNLKSQLTQKQRQHVQENLDLIRLHRELKQKNTKILSTQMQFSDLEEKMKMLKLNHDHLIKDNEDLALRFKSEQKKNLELLEELQKAEIKFSASSEFQDRIKSLMKENDVLRETNDKLIKNTVAVEKETSPNESEQVLKEKISSLEASLDFHIKSKTLLQEELYKEKGSVVTKDEAHKLLLDQLNLLKCRMKELEKKIDLLKSEEIDFEELQESLNLLKLKKSGQLDAVLKVSDGEKSSELERSVNKSEFSESAKTESNQVDSSETDDKIEQLECRLRECEAELRETLQELSNVREMLTSQCDVNKNSREEILLLTAKLEEKENEYHTKLVELSSLLDTRSAHIEKLEKQLNDIVFGTQMVTTPSTDSHDKNSSPVKLKKGENLFEIVIAKINFSAKGLQKLHNSNSKVFLTWNFYEFELQSTPVVPANKPTINFTAQYTVQVDDCFLWYLNQNAVTIELHESLGIEYRTLASCRLAFSNIFSKTKSKNYLSAVLLSTYEEFPIEFGTLEYCFKLKIPIEEAIKSFKEKIKALGYIHSNKQVANSAETFVSEPHKLNPDNNELHIKILRGINLKSSKTDAQPTTFCVYKFFDLPDQDTNTIPASTQPEYLDHHIFTIHLDNSLHNYIQSENLFVYVFDENEPNITSHIGKASIPLQPLVHNKPIKGTFELQKDGKSGYGSIEVLIYWQFDYVPPLDDLQKVIGSSHSVHESSTSLSERSDDEISAVEMIPPDDPSILKTPVPKPRKSVPPRKDTSTPLTKSSGIFSNSDGSTEILSPKISPALHHSQKHAAVQRGTNPISKDINQSSSSDPSLQDKTKHEPYWSDVMSDTDKRAYYEDTSEAEKPNFYDDSDDSVTDSEEYQLLTPTIEKVPTITIKVSHLRLAENANVLQDSSVKLLFIEYRFLDYPLEELETPFSLPKRTPPEKIEFNFVKKFPLQLKDSEKWTLLSNMFVSDVPDSTHIQFTVVSEPGSEDQESVCEDIGVGSVDLCEIIKFGEDKIDEDIDIYDAQDRSVVIGRLNVTIQALDVLLLLRKFANDQN